MKMLALVVVYLVGLNTPISTNAQVIDGTWNAYIQTIEGKVEIIYQFQTEGDKLTGSVITPQGAYLISDGSVNGSTISYVIEYGEMKVFYTGYYLREQLLISASFQGNTDQITLNRVKDD